MGGRKAKEKWEKEQRKPTAVRSLRMASLGEYPRTDQRLLDRIVHSRAVDAELHVCNHRSQIFILDFATCVILGPQGR